MGLSGSGHNEGCLEIWSDSGMVDNSKTRKKALEFFCVLAGASGLGSWAQSIFLEASTVSRPPLEP